MDDIKELDNSLRVRDLFCSKLNWGIENVQLINECNETLISLANVYDNVCSLESVLSEEILDREIIGINTEYKTICVKLKGVDDAE